MTALDDAREMARILADIDKARADQIEKRNTYMRQAYAEGATVAELSRAVGLTRAMVYRVIEDQ